MARQQVVGSQTVNILTAQFPEDHKIIAADFLPTVDLDRSVLDLAHFASPRKLPLFRDILERLYESSPNADYLIYTNVDIAVQPHFYTDVARLVGTGLDAFVVTRRTIDKRYTSIDELPRMYAETGEPHPGHDCFVFRRQMFPSFYLTNVCLGATWFDKVLLWNLVAHSHRFAEFRDLFLTFHIGNDLRWKRSDSREYSLHNKNELTRLVRHFEETRSPAYLDTALWPYIKHVYGKLGFSSKQTRSLWRLSMLKSPLRYFRKMLTRSAD